VFFDFAAEDGRSIPTAVPALPIWKLCHALYSAGFLQFRVSLLGRGGEPTIREFWEHALTLPWGRNHPALTHKPNLGTVLPLTIHLDGAEIYTSSEYWVLSFSSAVVRNCNVVDCKFPILKLPYSAIRDGDFKHKANKTMADFIAWNFEVLKRAVGPQLGFYGEPLHSLVGEPLMGPYSAACIGFKADLKARREAHGFTQHYNAIRVCERCSAVQCFPSVARNPDLLKLLFSDVSADAPWRSTRITHEEYLAKCRGASSPWYSCLRFV